MNGPYIDAEVFIGNTLKQKWVIEFMLLRSCATVISIKMPYESKKHSPGSFLKASGHCSFILCTTSLVIHAQGMPNRLKSMNFFLDEYPVSGHGLCLVIIEVLNFSICQGETFLSMYKKRKFDT